MPKTPKHPMQPIVIEESGVARFKENPIVQYLLDNSPFDLNDIARLRFDSEDQEQFAQLIGYSVSGFGELSYVSQEAIELADEQVYELTEGANDANESDGNTSSFKYTIKEWRVGDVMKRTIKITHQSVVNDKE